MIFEVYRKISFIVLSLLNKLVLIIKKDATMYVLGDFFQLGVTGFLLLPYYIKILSIEEYAGYAIYTTYVTLFTYITQFGLISVYFREVIFEPHCEGRIRGTLYIINAIVFVILLCLVFIFKEHLVINENGEIVYIAIVLSMVLFYNNILYSKLRIDNKVKKYVTLQVTMVVVYIVVMFTLVEFLEDKLLAIILSLFTSNIIILSFFVKSIFGNIDFERKFIINKTYGFLKFSMPVFLSYLLYFLYLKFNVFLISYFASPNQVATLNLAMQIALVMVIVSGALGKYYQPLLFGNKSTDLIRFQRKLSVRFRLILIIFGMLLFAFAYLFLNLLIEMKSFEDLLYITGILILSNTIYYMCSMESFFFQYIRKTSYSLGIMACSTIFTVLTSLITVQSYGVKGVAFSILGGAIVHLSISLKVFDYVKSDFIKGFQSVKS